MRTPEEELIAKWRAEAARIDTIHATMGAGWRICADELETLLIAAVPHPQENVLSSPMAAGLLLKLKEECEAQHARAEAAEAALRAYGQHSVAALKDAWLDGFRDEHVRNEDSAWRHSITRIAIEERTHPFLLAVQRQPQEAGKSPRCAACGRISGNGSSHDPVFGFCEEQ